MIYKTLNICFVLIILVCTVNAELCSQDNAQVNCTVVTPTILCDEYNYIIINESGEVLCNESLTPLNDSIYSFVFNYTDGNYIVKLCDSSVKEINVGNGDDTMSSIGAFGIGLILIPLIFGFMLLLSSFFLGEEHSLMKMFMFGLSFVTVFSSFYFASNIIYTIDPTNTNLQDAIGKTMLYTGMFYFVLIVYIIIYFIVKLLKAIKQDKEEKLNY
jgi:hypothetical protein